MEPATAPQPDMAPELTPEEEQVSGALAAAVGVSGPPRPRPASAHRGGALHGPRCPFPRRPRPRPSAPEPGDAAGRGSRPLLFLRLAGLTSPPPPIPVVIKVPRTGEPPCPSDHPQPAIFAEHLLVLWPLHPSKCSASLLEGLWFF